MAKLLAAATAGAAPAGPASKRQPIRIVLCPDDRPVGKGVLCAQAHAFNLQAATRVAANDQPGRERLCRYILRPRWPMTGCTFSTTEAYAWTSRNPGSTAPRR